MQQRRAEMGREGMGGGREDKDKVEPNSEGSEAR